MTKEELFSRLWEMVKDTEVDFEYFDEFLDFSLDGEVCVRFRNIRDEVSDDQVN